jgi:hypothetical protein
MYLWMAFFDCSPIDEFVFFMSNPLLSSKGWGLVGVVCPEPVHILGALPSLFGFTYRGAERDRLWIIYPGEHPFTVDEQLEVWPFQKIPELAATLQP